jgi:membrane protein
VLRILKLRNLKNTIGQIVHRYAAVNGGSLAQIIAWNGLSAFLPMTLVAVALLGILLGNHGIASGIEDRVAGAIGNGADKQAVLSALHTFQQKSGIFALLGMASLVFSASALIGAFDQAFNALYECKPRTFFAQKRMAVGVMIVFTICAIPLVASSSLLSSLKYIPRLPQFLYSGPGALLLQVALGVLDGVVLFGIIYYVVPHRHQRWRDIFPGALTAAILLELVTLLWPLYFKLSNGFATYGKTFSLLFLLLAYFYLLGQIIVIGATVNAVSQDTKPAKAQNRP